MIETERDLKLRQIAQLHRTQIQGWYDAATMMRQPFPGEIAALHDRAVIAGVVLKTNPDRAPCWTD